MSTEHLLYYRSRLDDHLQPLPLCDTGGTSPRALILDVSPGAIGDLNASVERSRQLAALVTNGGEQAVVAKPCGRGPGSAYQGPGEVDFFEAVEFLCQQFPIDRDRISVTGASMGGAATWYLASHYPDFFSAAAPFCGYCDYRLWSKPGGMIMTTHEWEHPSWESRGAAFRTGNLCNIALWVVHGEWDTPIGGGVSVAHSRRMVARLTELGIAHNYTEVPGCGHDCMRDDILEKVLPWLARQRRRALPNAINLTAHTLRHNRSHYLQINAFEEYGQPAHVAARLGETLTVDDIRNVASLTVGPIPGQTCNVTVEGRDMGLHDLTDAVTFARHGDRWERVEVQPVSTSKKPGQSGPIGDIFFQPIRIVLGTMGSPHENFILEWLVRDWVSMFKSRNGGVHRGIFHGQSFYELAVVPDTQITGAELSECNLILAGTPRSNTVWQRIVDRLPFEIGEAGLTLAGRAFMGRHVGAAALFPSPFGPQRYVLAIGGTSPEAIAGSTHLNFQLLPDYIVWEGETVHAWGSFNGNWGWQTEP